MLINSSDLVSAHLLIWFCSSRTKLTFYNADSRANYKDLSALQCGLPLGLCAVNVVESLSALQYNYDHYVVFNNDHCLDNLVRND